MKEAEHNKGNRKNHPPSTQRDLCMRASMIGLIDNIEFVRDSEINQY